jgi:hypothetical protein
MKAKASMQAGSGESGRRRVRKRITGRIIRLCAGVFVMRVASAVNGYQSKI